MQNMRKLIVDFNTSLCKGYVGKSIFTDELVERWFGRYHKNNLVLELIEIAYLISQGRVSVRIGDTVVESIEDLVKNASGCFDKSFWPMLSVYKDLRDRGRRVRVLGPMKFLAKDKTGSLRLIYVLEEKYEIPINTLHEVVSEARRNDLSATLAIVSLHGELTYYDLISADLRVESVDGTQST